MKKFKMKIKIGDMVQILTGTDRGKSGKILAIFPKKNRVLVQGINTKFRHIKSTDKDKKGEIKQIELPIDYSNLKLIN